MKKYLFLLPLTALLFLNFTISISKTIRKGKDYALLFAVEKYDDSHLPALKYPIENVKEIKAELENNYGFECQLVLNPTNKEIKQWLNEYSKKFANGTFDKEGQLFVFFSGHGERESSNGFFLAKDTKTDDLESTAFSYGLWRNKIDEIPCKHILVAIDACKSGSFDPASERGDLFGTRGNELSDADKLIQEAARLKTRRFFSSGAMNASTPDNSLFAYQFLAALRSYGNLGSIKDNILTVTELSIFLETATPKPIGGKFGSDQASSNFLFIGEDKPNSAEEKSEKGLIQNQKIRKKAFNPTSDMEDIVRQINQTLGLKQNFIIKKADCLNVIATVQGNQRYLLYNSTFIENFKRDDKSQWAAVFLVSHEIGHHLNIHDFNERDNQKRRIMELEADQFAGFVLYNLGATLEEAQEGVKTFALENEPNNRPPKSARLEAVASGWKRANELSKN